MTKVAIGELVRYHPIIGGDHDGKLYEITAIDTLPSRRRVAWLKGKSGCVSLRALSKPRTAATETALWSRDIHEQ